MVNRILPELLKLNLLGPRLQVMVVLFIHVSAGTSHRFQPAIVAYS